VGPTGNGKEGGEGKRREGRKGREGGEGVPECPNPELASLPTMVKKSFKNFYIWIQILMIFKI